MLSLQTNKKAGAPLAQGPGSVSQCFPENNCFVMFSSQLGRIWGPFSPGITQAAPGDLPPRTELEQTVHKAQQEAGVGVVGGKDDVPVLLQEVQDAQEAQALGEGLLGLGEAVQDDFIQAAV